MTAILVYFNRYYNFTGGLDIIMIFINYLKKFNKKCYICPILKNINSLNITTQLHNIKFENLTQNNLIDFYNNKEVNGLCSDKSQINTIDPDLIVPIDILKNKNNIIIYFENVMGNPANQKHVVRWLLFFPLYKEILHYDFNNEFICFYSHYIFNLYSYICKFVNIPDILTPNINKPNYLKIIKFERHLFENISNNFNKTDNKWCYMIRKSFPPTSFKNCNKLNNCSVNEIKSNIINKIRLIKKNNHPILKYNYSILKKINNNNLTKQECIELIKQQNNEFGFTEITNVDSTQKYIDIFKNKTYFISYDPFSFTQIIAALCGCISIVKPIDGIDFSTFINSEPLVKYGIAYGRDTIKHAKDTRHLLIDHISNLYNENETYVINFIRNIENYFNVKIDSI